MLNKDLYTVSFDFVGRERSYQLDVRRLACQGVPKNFDPKLVVPSRLIHMQEILRYVDSRRNSNKQNAFSNIKGYLLWCEAEQKEEFTLSTFLAYQDTSPPTHQRKEVARLHRALSVDIKNTRAKGNATGAGVKKACPKGKVKCSHPKRLTSTSFTESDKEGIFCATDGSHLIAFKTRSSGTIKKNIAEHISHLSDQIRFFDALRELLSDVSGDTFGDHLTSFCAYARFSKSRFFDPANLHDYYHLQKSVVDTKSNGANVARRKVRHIIRLFDIAEAPFPETLRYAASKLPSPRSTPVNGYDDKTYKMLLRELFRTFKVSSEKLLPKNDTKPDSDISALSDLMNSAYYLISRYSAWTDSTIKNIKVSDINFDSQDGEWVYLSADKMRGGAKTLEIEMPSSLGRIKKTGFSVIDTLTKIHQLHGIKSPLLLFSIDKSGAPAFFKRSSAFTKRLASQIPNLGTLSSQRIRETEISISHRKDGIKGAISRSGSSPAVVKRHYSEGSTYEHNSQLSGVTDTIHKIAVAAGKQATIKEIKEIKENLRGRYNIPIIQDLSAKSNTPIGTFCENPSKERFPKRAERMGFGTLACADLIACFECKSAALIDSVDDIWNILSFKDRLTHGRLFSVDRTHHAKNFNEVTARIELILEKFNPDNVEKASRKLKEEGSHPFWDGEDIF